MGWAQLTLFLYITMRMTGFILLNPLFGRRGIPGLVKAGFILVLAATVFSLSGDAVVEVPTGILVLSLRLLMELALGFLLGFVMQLFFYIPVMAGQIIDNQMGLSMATIYDAGSQINNTLTSTLLNVMMAVLFFSANGHHTLLRIVLTSGAAVPFGAVAVGPEIYDAMVLLFVECTLLGLKLSMPILAAEMIGEVGMGILMKTIPQINAFVINIELKVIVGLFLVFLLMTPFSEFLLDAERVMLNSLGQVLAMAG